jgi:hypothetical protein
MNAFFHNVTAVKFGRCDEWPGLPDKPGSGYRVYHLEIRDRDNKAHSVELFTVGVDTIPTICSEVTDKDGGAIGDWLTDSIDGANLDLPTLSEEGQPSTNPITFESTANRLANMIDEFQTKFFESISPGDYTSFIHARRIAVRLSGE